MFFQYGGDLSISSELANGLKQKFPSKTIVVGYVIGSKINLSIRGDNVKDKISRVIKEMVDATGGGHQEAVGAKIRVEDWESFKNKFNEFFK